MYIIESFRALLVKTFYIEYLPQFFQNVPWSVEKNWENRFWLAVSPSLSLSYLKSQIKTKIIFESFGFAKEKRNKEMPEVASKLIKKYLNSAAKMSN